MSCRRSPPPPEDDEGLHFRDLWRVVVKRKWVVFAVFAARARDRAGLDDDADADLPRDDHAEDRARGAEDRRLQGRARHAGGYGDIDFYRTQYELLKSRTLAERVVEQLNLRQASAPKNEGPQSVVARVARRDTARRRKSDGGAATPRPRLRATRTGSRSARSWAR